MHLIQELRRRRVFRVASVYLAVALGSIYAADVILPRLRAPDWTVAAVIVLAGLGFLVALALAWAFDVTPAGVVRTDAPPDDADAPEALPPLDRRAIAVLPFENMSADGTEYFSDGISEEIINALAQLPELRVAGRTSAFSFKGRQDDLRTIGRSLNVGTVLEGSVRQVGNRVRITAQLVDTSDGYHLWSQRYDRDLHDIFMVQDEIARAIADHLAVTLGARAARPLVTGHPDDPEAYSLFLRGRQHVSQVMEPGFTLAVESYRAAIERAPRYALAWAGVAEAELIRGALLDEPYDASPSRARAAAMKALELDDRIAEAHAALGGVQTYFDLDWEGAERSFRRALELNPGSAWARTWYGELLAFTGRTAESVEQAQRACDIEPLSPLFRWNIIQNLWLDGRLDDADGEARRTLHLFHDAYFAHFFLGMTAWVRGDAADAIGGLEKAVAATDGVPLIASQLAAVCYSFGERRRGDEIFTDIRNRADTTHVSAGAFVLMHAARGEVDDAIRWLKLGHRRKDAFFCQIKAFFRATPLPLDPRLADEFDRIGFL